MRIALATSHDARGWDPDLKFIAAAIRRRGAEAEVAVWDDPEVDWQGFDLVLINSTWDYNRKLEAFSAWLEAISAVTRVRNEPSLVSWNLDKRYLRELESAGVPTIPTIWLDPDDPDGGVAAIEDAGWEDVIIKPTVDLGAERLARTEPAMAPRIIERLGEPGLAQPFISSVPAVGEISVFFFGGERAHAVRKVPATGDFRVQPTFGATHERIEAPAAAQAVARAALAAAPGEPLYARADLVSLDDGRQALIELELIEPSFYFDVAPENAEILARRLQAAAAGVS